MQTFSYFEHPSYSLFGETHGATVGMITRSQERGILKVILPWQLTISDKHGH
jgi:hypothetical protein